MPVLPPDHRQGRLRVLWFDGLALVIAFQRIVSGVNVFSLLAIPFFIFAGELMFHGGIALRLARFAVAAGGGVSISRLFVAGMAPGV
jgi:TRAP-type C4-dicarboxylate transport system permease large subunit